jgi:DUF1009 family protein
VRAQSLVAGDVVALEATSGTDTIVSMLQEPRRPGRGRQHAQAQVDHRGQGQD